MRRATVVQDNIRNHKRISIHALREEGDPGAYKAKNAYEEFLSTPSVRRATKMGRRGKGVELFLSTPSVRRATKEQLEILGSHQYFYPRPP